MRVLAGALTFGGYRHRGRGYLTQQARADAPFRPCYVWGVLIGRLWS